MFILDVLIRIQENFFAGFPLVKVVHLPVPRQDGPINPFEVGVGLLNLGVDVDGLWHT